jgi:4-hydroxybenzoate polyprenyltransferase
MSIAWLKPLIQTMRPRQWIKNGLLFIPLIFDKQLTTWPALVRVMLGFVLFCLLSSLVYIINDLMDFEADRNHPQKRLRPIASGKLNVSTARFAVILLGLIFFIPAIWLSREFALVGLVYLLLNLAYSAWLKHTPILDVMIIASFYVLRVGAGVVLINVHSSRPGCMSLPLSWLFSWGLVNGGQSYSSWPTRRIRTARRWRAIQYPCLTNSC